MFRSRITNEIRPHKRIPRICQLTLVDDVIWRSGMESNNSVQLPTFSEMSERSILRIEGWQLNGIVTLHSGTPYDVIYQGELANTGNTFVRANLVGNPTPDHRTASEWINTSVFAIPSRYTFGDLRRNSLRSDWFRNVDF